MKFSSLGYLIKEGFRNIKQNSFMSFASVLVLLSCLLLSGAAYLVFINVEEAFAWAYDQNTVVVWATENATADDTAKLQNDLLALSNVSGAAHISKDEILNRFAGDIPEATFESLQGENNPMLDAFEVTFVDLSLFDETVNSIRLLDHVESVSHREDVAQVLVGIRDAVASIGIWIIFMLLLVSLFIISNTIKLTVYSRRLEINIMKSVGATKAFIRLPFVVEGVVLGFVSGLLSYGILYFVYTRLMTAVDLGEQITLCDMSILGALGTIPVWAELLLGFLILGTLTGMIGSAISITRYLKEESGVNID